jgi:acetyl esterase
MLDIQLHNLLEGMRASGAPDFADLPPAAARELYSQILARGDVPVADVVIEERRIDGPGSELVLRIYRPRGSGGVRGAVLYLHGGGFVVGRPQDYDGVASVLCAQADCVLVQVDYRLAPEHPFPAAVDDSYAALVWLAAHAGELGIDPARIAVAGDSAGANLATVCAILARDRGGPALVRQVLIYPVTAPEPGMFDSYRRHGEGYTLTSRSAWYFTELYLGGRRAVTDFRVAPLFADELGGLPPALVLVAGYDPLRDEGIAYADKLAAAGTHVTLVVYAGLAHGFISMGGALDAARIAVDQVASVLRRALAANTSERA